MNGFFLMKQLFGNKNSDKSVLKILGYLRFISYSSMQFVRALNDGDMKTVGKIINVEKDNLLFEARQGSITGLREMKDTILEAGAYGCAISGSGPAIFAICQDLDSAQFMRDKVLSNFSGRALKWLITPVNHEGSESVINIDDWRQAHSMHHNFW